MKRRGFLGSIAAGLAVLTTPEPEEFEQYYKVETIDRNPCLDISKPKEPEYNHVACSGVITHIQASG